jgi:hypothetical protein
LWYHKNLSQVNKNKFLPREALKLFFLYSTFQGFLWWNFFLFKMCWCFYSVGVLC